MTKPNNMVLNKLLSDIARLKSRTNCYWYMEWHGMSGTVPQCTLAERGECPCKNCENFLDEEEARNVVMKYFLDEKDKKR